MSAEESIELRPSSTRELFDSESIYKTNKDRTTTSHLLTRQHPPWGTCLLFLGHHVAFSPSITITTPVQKGTLLDEQPLIVVNEYHPSNPEKKQTTQQSAVRPLVQMHLAHDLHLRYMYFIHCLRIPHA